jgi:hypothetical protein
MAESRPEAACGRVAWGAEFIVQTEMAWSDRVIDMSAVR